MTTRARWSAAARTRAAPSPRPAPVTRMTLPFNTSSWRLIRPPPPPTQSRSEPDRFASDPTVRPQHDLGHESPAAARAGRAVFVHDSRHVLEAEVAPGHGAPLGRLRHLEPREAREVE